MAGEGDNNMDIELVDLTLDDDDEEFEESSSIYSLATIPAKREEDYFDDTDAEHTDDEPGHERSEQPPGEEEEVDEEEEEDEIRRAVTEYLERETAEWDEYDQRKRDQEEAARIRDCQAAAASLVSGVSPIRPLAPLAEASVGVSGDVPCSDTASIGTVELETVAWDDGNLTVQTIPGDGHCLFRACLHQRLPPSRRHEMPCDDLVAQLRQDVAQYMRENEDTLRGFYTSDLHRAIDLVEEGGWGDQTSLYVIATLWNVPVVVIMEWGPQVTHFPADQAASCTASPLVLAYRCARDDGGALVYNHYDSVVIMEDSCPVPGEGATCATPSCETPPGSPPSCETPPGSPPPHATPSCSPPPHATPSCSPPPSTSPPATPPRSSTASTASRSSRGSSRAPRRTRSPPVGSSPRQKRLRTAGGAARDTSGISGTSEISGPPLQSSQELVHPLSPTPGVPAPGSPNAECLGAVQPPQRAAPAPQDDTAAPTLAVVDCLIEDDMEGLRATAFSPALTSRSRPITPVSLNGGLIPHTARTRLLPPEPCAQLRNRPIVSWTELTSEQKTREWVLSQTLSEVSDDDEEISLVSPDGLEGLFEMSDDEEEADHFPDRRDVSTGVTTICGEITSCLCLPSKSEVKRLLPKNPPKTRTVSTNVVLSCGKLIGTFQVLDI